LQKNQKLEVIPSVVAPAPSSCCAGHRANNHWVNELLILLRFLPCPAPHPRKEQAKEDCFEKFFFKKKTLIIFRC
jgi:hypothetical protein